MTTTTTRDDPDDIYVELDVVEELLDVGVKRVYQLRRTEGWRMRGRLYNLKDVARTARQRLDAE